MTRARDALAAERRRMPWLAVEQAYEFEGPDGRASLLDLFEGRRQLIVYRAFFEPGVFGWPEHACRGCSMVADQVAHVAHLNARDTTLAFASRAPQADIDRLKARMGWEMPWYTLTDGFDADFGVDEWHGTNAFLRDGDRVFRTYFVNDRGDEAMGGTWAYLDITALGRQEEWEDSPAGYPQTPAYDVVELARRVRRRRGMIAHIGGVPVEEALLPWVGSASAGLLLARVVAGTSAVRAWWRRRVRSAPCASVWSGGSSTGRRRASRSSASTSARSRSTPSAPSKGCA